MRRNPARCAAAFENRVRAVNGRAARTEVRSPGGTTGLTRWYL